MCSGLWTSLFCGRHCSVDVTVLWIHVPPLPLVLTSTALSCFGDALSMRMSILNEGHVDTIATLHNMARVASFQGK